MPDANQNATAGDNAGNTNNADTSTANNQNEGGQQGQPPLQQQNQSNTSTDNKQNEGAKSKSFTQDEVNNLLAKERKEAERKAKMTEDERMKSDLEDARKQLRERDTRDAVQTEAQRLGARNGGLIYRAVKDDLTFDGNGKPENLAAVLAQAKKDFPELFGAVSNGSADGGDGKSHAQSKTMNDWMRGK